MKILVVGGTGHLGRQIVSKLDCWPEFEVSIGSRRPDAVRNGVYLDIDRPETFGVTDEFETIINCTDTYRHSPKALFQHCIENGLLFIETTADTDAYLDLFETYDSLPKEKRQGIGILGLGVFPGLSNLVAAEAARDFSTCSEIELHLSWSVISGAGAGTCEVMVQSLARPIRHARNGRIVPDCPIGKPRSVELFPGLRNGFEIGLPESVLMHRSIKVDSTSTFATLRPAMPKWLIRLVHFQTRMGMFRPRLIQLLLGFFLRTIRCRILGNRSTELEIAAVAWCKDHTTKVIKQVRYSDAFQAAADTICECLMTFRNRPEQNPGVYTADQLFELNQVIDNSQSLGQDLVRTD